MMDAINELNSLIRKIEDSEEPDFGALTFLEEVKDAWLSNEITIGDVQVAIDTVSL